MIHGLNAVDFGQLAVIGCAGVVCVVTATVTIAFSTLLVPTRSK
jgi:hypothetical protein